MASDMAKGPWVLEWTTIHAGAHSRNDIISTQLRNNVMFNVSACAKPDVPSGVKQLGNKPTTCFKILQAATSNVNTC
eukprot:6330458-Amphidinium_carterae.2